ncbi:hypothetical protein GGX14DRAFT_399572 [Mycena pura]|uniref:Uncharacterized protein n=1 Tax=Mycena pura TaxID=153505 RepID=A0AAD6VBI0_9AGAR|nr:hypothetical protein GGX14DRAFT_399572 [Mycena pura]
MRRLLYWCSLLISPATCHCALRIATRAFIGSLFAIRIAGINRKLKRKGLASATREVRRKLERFLFNCWMNHDTGIRKVGCKQKTLHTCPAPARIYKSALRCATADDNLAARVTGKPGGVRPNTRHQLALLGAGRLGQQGREWTLRSGLFASQTPRPHHRASLFGIAGVGHRTLPALSHKRPHAACHEPQHSREEIFESKVYTYLEKREVVGAEHHMLDLEHLARALRNHDRYARRRLRRSTRSRVTGGLKEKGFQNSFLAMRILGSECDWWFSGNTP